MHEWMTCIHMYSCMLYKTANIWNINISTQSATTYVYTNDDDDGDYGKLGTAMRMCNTSKKI